MMRKFWLENAVGERMAFQYAAQFLWEPQGLGVDENASNYEVSYGFFAQAAQEYGQPNISGTVVFFGITANPTPIIPNWCNGWNLLGNCIWCIPRTMGAKCIWMLR